MVVDVPDPRALLGANSVSWRMLKPWRKLGLQRNVLMQLARPEIASAVSQYSDFMQAPLPRFARTVGVLATIRHGSPEQRAAVLDRLAAAHGAVRGRTESGVAFAATEPELQWWVLACGLDTSLQVESRYIGRLTEHERARYYAEQAPVIESFGIPSSLVPPSLAAFRQWMADEVDRLAVSDDARRIADVLLDPNVVPFPRAISHVFRAVTAGLLPDRLRAAYRLDGSAARREEALLRTTIRVTRPMHGHIPGRPARRATNYLEHRLLDAA